MIEQTLRGSFIVLLANEIRFDDRNYGEEAILRESKIIWERISINYQQQIPIKITRTELNLQDEYINLGSPTKTSADVFELDMQSRKPYELDETLVAVVTFEMNLDQHVIIRLHYSFLDLLSGLGGFLKAVGYTGAIGASLMHLKNVDDFLVPRLYNFSSDEKEEDQSVEKRRRLSCCRPKDKHKQALVKQAKKQL